MFFRSWLRTRANSLVKSAVSLLTSTFVPIVVVTGRSVFSRTVRQGTHRNVVSSWILPESAMTTAPCF